MSKQDLATQLRLFRGDVVRIGSNDNLQLVLTAADVIEQASSDPEVASAMLAHSFVAQRNKDHEYAAARSKASAALR